MFTALAHPRSAPHRCARFGAASSPEVPPDWRRSNVGLAPGRARRTTVGSAAVQPGEEPLGCNRAVGVLDDLRHLVPVHFQVEPGAKPTTMTDVRRNEE